MGYADAERRRAEILEWWCKKENMVKFKRSIGQYIPISQAYFIETAAEIGWFGDGDTYSVAGPIVGMVAQAAETIPDLTIRAEMFKSPCAFVWLESPYIRPLPSEEHRGTIYQVELWAISWQYVNMTRMDDPDRPYDWAHPSDPDQSNGVSITFWCKANWASVPVPAAWGTILWGENWSAAKRRYEESQHLIRGTKGEEAMGDTYHNFLLSLLSFIESEVLITERQEVENKGARKRIKIQTKRDPRAIQVVKLRRRSQGETEAEERREIEYGCQWMVGGHWRQQACGPRMSQRRAVWIKPYRKGDPSKPFNEKARRVYEVVR